MKPFVGCCVLLEEWERTRDVFGGAELPDYCRGTAGVLCVPLTSPPSPLQEQSPGRLWRDGGPGSSGGGGRALPGERPLAAIVTLVAYLRIIIDQVIKHLPSAHYVLGLIPGTWTSYQPSKKFHFSGGR